MISSVALANWNYLPLQTIPRMSFRPMTRSDYKVASIVMIGFSTLALMAYFNNHSLKINAKWNEECSTIENATLVNKECYELNKFFIEYNLGSMITGMIGFSMIIVLLCNLRRREHVNDYLEV